MPTHFKGAAEEELALNTYIKVTRAVDTLTQRLKRGGTMGGLTMSQFGVLEALYHLGPMCQGDLGHKILRSSGNMTLVIDNLEKHGFVRRTRSEEDRRQITVNLTGEGRKLIASIFPDHAQAIVGLFSSLDPEEQEALGNLCRKLGREERGEGGGKNLGN